MFNEYLNNFIDPIAKVWESYALAHISIKSKLAIKQSGKCDKRNEADKKDQAVIDIAKMH